MADPNTDIHRVARRRFLAQIPEKIGAVRFDEAFAAAERVLDLAPSAEDFEFLLSPQRGTAPQRGRDSRDFSVRQMYDILAALGRREDDPWRLQLRFCLLERLQRGPEAFALTEKLRGLPERYGWMRFHRGDMLLRTYGSYPQAREELLAAFELAPAFWKAGALAAEASLCAGEPSRAFAMLDALAGRTKGRNEKMSLLSWRGEMRLWTGQFRLALDDLNEAAAGGARLALCWRGAARLALGMTEEALDDLSAHLVQNPDDREALVWRAEALRRRGRTPAALKDLNRILEADPRHLFALVNRALVHAEAGDRPALRRDLDGLPSEIRDYFEWKTGTAPERGAPAKRVVEMLEGILTAAGGIRRSDRYLFPLWLKERP